MSNTRRTQDFSEISDDKTPNVNKADTGYFHIYFTNQTVMEGIGKVGLPGISSAY